jgi:hypothetical protein
MDGSNTPTNTSGKTLDDLFPADRDLIDEGVLFELGGGSALKVRRIDNKQFQGFVETMQKKHRFQFDHNLLAEDDKVKLMIPGIARFLLVGWEVFPPQAPLPYSVPGAEKLLAERKTLVRAVLGMANETRVYVREREEATAKNLPTGSHGNSGGEGG